MKTFAIGDVHGQYRSLEKLLSNLPIDWQQDELVFVGDLIDRGPSPRRVLEFVRNLQVKNPLVRVLRGNHEQILLDCFETDKQLKSFKRWLNMGAEDTYADYCPSTRRMRWATFASCFPGSMREYLRSLPISYRNDHAIYVHAGMRRNTSGEWHIDSIETALWARTREFWVEYEGKTVVVGHTPTNKIRKLLNEPLMPNNQMGAWHRESLIAIDCGASQGGQLCAVELPARTFYYQPIIQP